MKRAKGGLAQDPRLKEVVGQGTTRPICFSKIFFQQKI
jgi:hypothetical protein